MVKLISIGPLNCPDFEFSCFESISKGTKNQVGLCFYLMFSGGRHALWQHPSYPELSPDENQDKKESVSWT
jgi:hypothetical protein